MLKGYLICIYHILNYQNTDRKSKGVLMIAVFGNQDVSGIRGNEILIVQESARDDG